MKEKSLGQSTTLARLRIGQNFEANEGRKSASFKMAKRAFLVFSIFCIISDLLSIDSCSLMIFKCVSTRLEDMLGMGWILRHFFNF